MKIKTKSHTVIADRIGRTTDYRVGAHLLLCGGVVRKIATGIYPRIKVTVSTAPMPRAKCIFIHPGHKNWGWTANRTVETRYRGMYSYAALLLYTKLGVNALGDTAPWFPVKSFLSTLLGPVPIYIKITKT